MDDHKSSYKLQFVEVVCYRCKRSYSVLGGDAYDYIPAWWQTANHEVRFWGPESQAPTEEANAFREQIDEAEDLSWAYVSDRVAAACAATVDRSPSGGKFYGLCTHFPCPTCGTIDDNDRLVKQDDYSGARIDVPYVEATHDGWYSLTFDEKEQAVRDAMAPWSIKRS